MHDPVNPEAIIPSEPVKPKVSKEGILTCSDGTEVWLSMVERLWLRIGLVTVDKLNEIYLAQAAEEDEQEV